MVDGCEILHQLIDGQNHDMIRLFTMFHRCFIVTTRPIVNYQLAQDFATIQNPQYLVVPGRKVWDYFIILFGGRGWGYSILW